MTNVRETADRIGEALSAARRRPNQTTGGLIGEMLSALGGELGRATESQPPMMFGVPVEIDNDVPTEKVIAVRPEGPSEIYPVCPDRLLEELHRGAVTTWRMSKWALSVLAPYRPV